MWDEEESEVGGPTAPPSEWAQGGNPLAPWHMWGNEQNLRTTLSGAPPVAPVATGQLLKIGYGRPETWRFVFYAQILQAAAAIGDIVLVDFDVTVGIGRSSATLGFSGIPDPAVVFGPLPDLTRGFARFRVVAGAGGFPATTFWTTRGISPPLGTLPDPALSEASVSEIIVAQDIQCRARVAGAGAGATALVVNVGAYFAPNVHVRPEWHTQGPNNVKFRGGETGGT